jgi:hypothetical protein
LPSCRSQVLSAAMCAANKAQSAQETNGASGWPRTTCTLCSTPINCAGAVPPPAICCSPRSGPCPLSNSCYSHLLSPLRSCAGLPTPTGGCCPTGTVVCGNNCCSAGQNCQNGICGFPRVRAPARTRVRTPSIGICALQWFNRSTCPDCCSALSVQLPPFAISVLTPRVSCPTFCVAMASLPPGCAGTVCGTQCCERTAAPAAARCAVLAGVGRPYAPASLGTRA